MPRVFGVDRIELGPDKLGGLIPVGTVIGFFSHISGAYAIPASGVVLDGFMRCDGAAIPMGNTLVGSVPNLSDNRFVMGATSSGATGGNASNQVALATGNLPSHSHVMDHGHGNSFSINQTNLDHTHSGSTGTESANHDHSISGGAHTHGFNWGTDGAGGTGLIGSTFQTNASFEFSDAGGMVTTSGSSHGHSIGTQSSNHTHSFSTGGPSISLNHNHGISGGVTNFSGNTGLTGSGTPFDIRPLFVAAVYIIRVK
jgi:hypothetical protein